MHEVAVHAAQRRCPQGHALDAIPSASHGSTTIVSPTANQPSKNINSQILAVRVIPKGLREFEVELYATSLEEAQRLVERIARVVPQGPTHFVRPPVVRETEALDEGLFRVTATTAVPPGREWLAVDLLPSLLRERAPEGLIVHGPVVVPTDEQAARRFARIVQVRETARQPRMSLRARAVERLSDRRRRA